MYLGRVLLQLSPVLLFTVIFHFIQTLTSLSTTFAHFLLLDNSPCICQHCSPRSLCRLPWRLPGRFLLTQASAPRPQALHFMPIPPVPRDIPFCMMIVPVSLICLASCIDLSPSERINCLELLMLSLRCLGGLYVSASNTVPTGLQSVKWNIPGLSTSSTSTTTATLGNGTTIGALQLTVSDAEVVPVNVSSTGTTGVTVYGHQLVYLSGSSFESKFWAKEVDYAGETAYLVTWNEENTSGSGITPLTLKILGPATVAN